MEEKIETLSKKKVSSSDGTKKKKKDFKLNQLSSKVQYKE